MDQRVFILTSSEQIVSMDTEFKGIFFQTQKNILEELFKHLFGC